MKRLIVSRHSAVSDFIRRELPQFADAPILASVTEADVAGAEVAGNLPLDLAAEAALVFAVTFPAGQAPRGQEFDLAAMDQAGARIETFHVSRVQWCEQCTCESDDTMSCALHDVSVRPAPWSPMCAAADCVRFDAA